MSVEKINDGKRSYKRWLKLWCGTFKPLTLQNGRLWKVKIEEGGVYDAKLCSVGL